MFLLSLQSAKARVINFFAVPTRLHEYMQRQVRRGFTLVELAVVIVIIGVLAAFGVPRFLKSVERAKAAEAFAFLSSVRAAQERYQAQQGTYADTMDKLDINVSTPRYFTVGVIGPGATTLQDSWSMTLTRVGASAGYGAYTVTFTMNGFDTANSTIVADVSPMS